MTHDRDVPRPDPLAVRAAIRGVLVHMARRHPSRAALLPLGPHAAEIREAALDEGWSVAAPPHPPAAALLFLPDARPDAAAIADATRAYPDLTLLCVVARPGAARHWAPTGWREGRSLPFHPRETLGHWIEARACDCRIPRSWIALCARIARAARVASTVGDRRIRHRARGARVTLLEPAAAPASSPGRDPIAPLKWFAVTCAGLGLSPAAPGTVASLAACVPALLLAGAPHAAARVLLLGGIALVSTALSVALERWATHHFLEDDPREFVLDEVAGMSLALLFLPPDAGWVHVALGFAAFRVLDIFKPGIRRVERIELPGAVVWDDLLAGLGAGLALLATRALPW